MRIPLTGGAYSSQSLIANAQRCINLYPERNGQDDEPPAPVTHLLTPGLKRVAQGIVAPVRCLYRASNGNLYTVIGTTVYFVTQAWQMVVLGTLSQDSFNMVTMVDNGTTILICDGSTSGYTISMASNAFAALVDGTGAFVGADKVDYMDGFFLLNAPGSQQFYATHDNTTTFDPLYYGAKTGWPDLLVTLAALKREIWLFGQLTTEVWYDAGGNPFPFAELPGTFIHHGCVAKWSVAVEDLSVFWLGQDLQGRGIVFRGSGYEARRISTHALEQQIQGYFKIDDAIGFCYQQNGHVFYVLTFPTADVTWVFDDATGLWHQRAWLDSDGTLHRHRVQCHANAYGYNVVGDWENGKLYILDQGTYTDDGDAIQRVRGFPHLVQDFKRVRYDRFDADMEVGDDPSMSTATSVSLRWSDDRGKTWGQPVLQGIGATGDYAVNLRWRRLGMARDRVFELSWSCPFKTSLQGAFVDFVTLRS